MLNHEYTMLEYETTMFDNEAIMLRVNNEFWRSYHAMLQNHPQIHIKIIHNLLTLLPSVEPQQ